MSAQKVYSDFEERDLVTAVQHGDCVAFREIHETHKERVYNLITYSLNDLTVRSK